jgi:hypothetical protein
MKTWETRRNLNWANRMYSRDICPNCGAPMNDGDLVSMDWQGTPLFHLNCAAPAASASGQLSDDEELAKFDSDIEREALQVLENQG